MSDRFRYSHAGAGRIPNRLAGIRAFAAHLASWAAVFAPLATATDAHALAKISRNPYIGAIAIDSDTGRVLFEENPDAPGYPASVTKLMTFAVVMDQVRSGHLTLETPVTVTAEAATTGGSQVYLKQGEVFSLDDLLYALLVPSANDAAVALAIQVAGSRQAFVDLMNAKAREFGLTHTEFHSPHGLPPSRGQQPDVTTARDLATLSRELIRRNSVLKYTSVKVRLLREKTPKPFEMRNHNALLGALPGCDGLKTGYYSAAGYSLAATAERNGRRVIAVILGSEQRLVRDVRAKELIEQGFVALPAAPAPAAQDQPPSGNPGGSIPTVRTDAIPPAPDRTSTATEPSVIFRVIPPSKQP